MSSAPFYIRTTLRLRLHTGVCKAKYGCRFLQSVSIKNNTVEKFLYFSNSSTDVGQNYKLCTGVFMQHMLQILLKKLIQFYRYSS